ncbi:MAG: TlpA disulfide reductase family protein [Woeseia sp.]
MARLLLAALLVAAAFGGYWLQSARTSGDIPALTNERTAFALPDEAPALTNERIAFTLPDLQGNPRDLDEWHGKALLVNFWATWCAPCRREIPLLKRTQDSHAADNLQVIGIAVDYTEDVVAYAEIADFNYPILVGQEDAMAAAENSGVEFVGLPFTMVISPDGQLIKTHIGEIVESHIEQIVAVLDRLQQGELDLDGARKALGRL